MKKTAQEKKYKKKKFPLGIFIMLLLVQSLIAAGGIGYYYYKTGQTKIADLEKFTRNFSITLAEAFAEVAELSHRSKNYASLKSLFREKIGENIIDEAFFVLTDGSLIVHSNKTIETELRGNIANDEFAYNLEMILGPIKKNTRDVMFTPYNIMGKNVPFTRQERELIGRYLYRDINVLGWLVTRGVYQGKNPIGTVNFLIYNDRIFHFLLAHIDEAKKTLPWGLGGAFALSLFISLIVLVRYRSIQKQVIDLSLHGLQAVPGRAADEAKIVVPLPRRLPSDSVDVVTIEFGEPSGTAAPAGTGASADARKKPAAPGDTSKQSGAAVIHEMGSVIDMGREIKDAIPISRRKQG
jgi:hypothetical protein